MFDSSTYKIHRIALEGRIFYDNDLAEGDNAKTYFPPAVGQDALLWEQAPKISFPITGDIIDRVVALIHSDMKIECDVKAMQDEIDARLEQLEWETLSRKFLTTALSEGNFLEVPRKGTKGIYYETWSGEYVFRDLISDTEILGYMYRLNKDGTMSPILSAPSEREWSQIKSVTINELTWDGLDHGLPFNPATFFRCVDLDKDNRYGKAYYLRFRDLILEYNQVYSQVSKAIKILQNVWETSLDRDNPANPVSITPDKLNHVGKEGFLRQAIRQLNIEPEITALDRVKPAISSRAQVPDFMTGLRDVGKVESGVALAIISAPLAELCARIRSEYKPKVKEFISKDIYMTYAYRKQKPPKFNLSVEMGASIIPLDIQKELENIYGAVDRQIVTPQEARIAALPLLKLQALLEPTKAN